VITSGGILGKIYSVDEKVVTLEIAGDVKVRMLKSSVQGKVNVEPANVQAEPKKEEK
jgi:preprotein translocase subunit YajC